jgi:hypothetical protein
LILRLRRALTRPRLQPHLTNGTTFAILVSTGKRATGPGTVIFQPRDLLCSSCARAIGFALRVEIQPEVSLHLRAFLSFHGLGHFLNPEAR